MRLMVRLHVSMRQSASARTSFLHCTSTDFTCSSVSCAREQNNDARARHCFFSHVLSVRSVCGECVQGRDTLRLVHQLACHLLGLFHAFLGNYVHVLQPSLHAPPQARMLPSRQTTLYTSSFIFYSLHMISKTVESAGKLHKTPVIHYTHTPNLHRARLNAINGVHMENNLPMGHASKSFPANLAHEN